jgi:uncharacterized protein DUF4397
MSFSRSFITALSIAALALTALVAGCGSKSNSAGSGNVRVLNAVLDVSALNVTVGNNTLVTGLAFEGLTTYKSVDGGTQEIKVSVPGSATNLIDISYPLSSGQNYTYVIYGPSTAATAVLLSDSVSPAPNTGQFDLRVTDAAAGSVAVDVYLTAPGAPLDNATPAVGNVAFGTSSVFAQLNIGTFAIRITSHNSKDVIYDSGAVTFADKASYNLIVYTKGSSTLVNAALLNIDDAGSGAVKNTSLAQFKAVHAAPGTAAINVRVDGTVALANIPYLAASGYQGVTAGAHTVTIETVTAPGATIASANPPFAPATDASVVLTGFPGAQTAFVLADTNLPGTVGYARVRFVNASPDVGPVDVLVNFGKRVSNLASGTASNYIELAEDTYVVNFDVANSTTVVLSLPAVAVTAARTYTIYLVGGASQLGSIQTRDD